MSPMQKEEEEWTNYALDNENHFLSTLAVFGVHPKRQSERKR